LDKYFHSTIKPIIDDLASNNQFTLAAFNSRFLNIDTQEITVNQAFKNKIDYLESEFRLGSAGVYKATIKALMRFKHF
ncbi:MAG TPA: hypothetical protein DEB12_08630, partial [Porphyromonadaceae bacterium]|nr:hypothetical protein [Porphyromonadaceae bacterium]